MLNASIFKGSQLVGLIIKSLVFTVSFLLLQRHQEISDLFEDFRDGIKLLALLEVLTSQILVSH